MSRWGLPRRRLSCRAVGRLLQTYLDSELTDARALVVAGHLDDCRRCGLDAASYRYLKQATAGLARPENPAQVERLRRFAEALIDG